MQRRSERKMKKNDVDVDVDGDGDVDVIYVTRWIYVVLIYGE